MANHLNVKPNSIYMHVGLELATKQIRSGVHNVTTFDCERYQPFLDRRFDQRLFAVQTGISQIRK
jgi:hypothetical protein